ncbi:S1 domain-containing RNA-binding protein [Lactiplantibacillus mudanjiangensis]|uniref:RNA-binding protein S1 [Lactobacillus sp.] n=1 Tax=Lactiplantibacillus mudanjiangensis TaxID=1296538 RepID=A0A660E0W8_9LACO|nr:S1 domain-containing RNA-binding protein [Lactiplantibacillus mudanjiangensis]VDG21454.1 RNA-binding protein S1 [Lactobacillus sp.] [Lactiplantibacillus mudanjiangensis]VDG25789.1 RNA-binding protein S1 [Lactobacillus sp.] [Lactiplantibacillus mudanjiangensis]VDG29024.1 RNA-binding protein S1 [Lactobacillus sp.] [Lactiplantibacillus mudanjiangensis]VDG31542.1 RNA-binding protein S1 [Lactobacillus sp.] [Lactiplantibacillus mudanjiangensis]
MAIEVGTKVTGKVSGITNFGAFVNLGNNQTGLVHISEVSDGFVKDIHDVLSVGDEVTVKVLTVGNDGKIGLSIRKAVDHPKGEHTDRDHHQSSSHQGSARPSNNAHGRTDRGEHQGNHRERTNNFHSRGGNGGGRFQSRQHENKKQDFDSLMSGFLKESEDRLTTLKRNTEGKRGGRGGRRS